MRFVLIAISLFVFSISAYGSSVDVSKATNPPDNQCIDKPYMSYAPLTSGPLRLISINCNFINDSDNRLREIANLMEFYSVSPDGNWLAAQEHKELAILSLRDGKRILQPNGTSLEGQYSLKWSKDSSFIWSSQRETVKPSGFFISGLQPIQVFTNGDVKILPPITHPSGLLDKIFWIDDKGIAFGAFGMFGDYYRPPIQNTDPAFAIIDAVHGVVLDSFLNSQIFGEKDHDINLSYAQDYAIRKLPDGKIKVVIALRDKLIFWTQGEKPRLQDDPYSKLRYRRIELTPDGNAVLVFQTLHTDGGIIMEPGSKDYAKYGGYTPGKPVEGVLAALYDLETAKERWAINSKVTYDSNPPPRTAISEDGKFGLIAFPTNDDSAYIALVSMADGKILQRLPFGYNSMGFYNKNVWINNGTKTAFYSFH